jgi:GntR family transcriptional regulator/MocR family aminotransferase
MLAEHRGLVTDPTDLLVTRGAQQALDLVAEVLLAPGDRVAVEAYGYPPAWEALGRRGALVPIPVDREGLDVGALRSVLAKTSLRAIYVTPHHQYPTMVGLSPARRLALLALAAQHHVAIIEDDFDHEVHYRGRPLLPLASADGAGVVVYVGTLSKVLAPGLRLGFVSAPRALIDALTEARRSRDRQGDRVLEHAVAELFEDGEIERHVRRMRKIYAGRRDALLGALQRSLGAVVRAGPSNGGMALWVEVDPAVDVERWAVAARDEGVLFATARAFRFDGRSAPYLRIGFAAVDEPGLEEAARRMSRALRRAR